MPTETLDSNRLAKLIVADSLRYSFSENGGGQAEVESALAQLRSPKGPSLTQAMMGQYIAAGVKDVAPTLDARIAESVVGAINVTAKELQSGMEQELAQSLGMTAEQRREYIKMYGELG